MASYHFIYKLVALIWIRFYTKPAITILTSASRLFFVPSLRRRHAAYSFSIRNTQRNNMCVQARACLQTIKQNGNLSLTNSRHNGLARFFVAINMQSRVCSCTFFDKCKNLALTAALVWLDSNAVQRIGEPKRSRLYFTCNRESVSCLNV